MKNQITVGTMLIVEIMGTRYVSSVTGIGEHKGRKVYDLDICRFCYAHQVIEILG